MKIARYILLSNGLYDVVCAWSILSKWGSPLSGLHIDMFLEAGLFDGGVTRTLLAHWILLNGLLRLAGAVVVDPMVYTFAMCSYFLEIYCLSAMYNSLVVWRFLTVVMLCMAQCMVLCACMLLELVRPPVRARR